MTRASVVIPTKGRPALLKRCLESVLHQDFDEPYEVIVVDDGPSIATKDVVQPYSAANPRRLYVPVVGAHGPAAARNAGWKTAQGSIIAFTDDDCIPARDWLRNGVQAMRPGIAAVSGQIQMPLPLVPTDYEKNAALLQTSEFVTANCFCRRAALIAIGGFDERFRRAWREDSDLQFRLMTVGAVVRRPSAVVVHPIRPAPWGVSLKQVKNSFYDALLFKKHPDLYCARVEPQKPWTYYGIVVSLLAAVVGFVFQDKWLVATGFSLWFLGTVRFFQIRMQGTSKSFVHLLDMVVTSVLIPPLAIFWRVRGAVHFRALYF